MEIKGQIIKILPIESGASWEKQSIVLQPEGQYAKPVCITFFKDKVSLISSLFEGETITVHINVSSREHNERWYTEINGWRVEK